jgi:triosephosphate isomerase
MNSQQRRPLIGGNWKMHMLRGQAEAYCKAFGPEASQAHAQVVLFPSHPLLAATHAALAGSTVPIGGQDLHVAEKGAHTGDVSGAQLADAGCTWVLCGHSERRADHGESNELVGQKAEAALVAGITPMICVGETAAQREAGETFDVLGKQLSAALASQPSSFALAYEPVWAIGTGKTATAEIAQEAHEYLRESLADLLGDEIAGAKRILYGGSVNPDNAAELYAQPDIDGFLVGGASLDPAKFLAIIRCCG